MATSLIFVSFLLLGCDNSVTPIPNQQSAVSSSSQSISSAETAMVSSSVESGISSLALSDTTLSERYLLSPTTDTLPEECWPTKEYTITGVTIIPEEYKLNSKGATGAPDTLRRRTFFDIKAEVVEATLSPALPAHEYPETHLIDSTDSDCYYGLIANPSRIDHSKIFVNKPIVFKGDTIPAHTNLKQYREMGEDMLNINMSFLYVHERAFIWIHDDFEFGQGEHTFTFEWYTYTNEVIRDSTIVYLDIDYTE
ncbi:MAG: hypothetical protein OCD01_08420 [Fibrobacterales bacterium]